MDYISGFFLVFSGLALGFYAGYLLFFKDRSADEKRKRTLTRENDDLRTSLKIAHGSHEKLETRFTRQTGQLKTLQQLCNDWTASRQQTDHEHGELEEALRSKTERLTELQAELKSEKQIRIKLEDSKHMMHQNFTEKQAIIDETWRKQNAKTEVELNQLKSDLAASTGEKDRVSQRLHKAEAQVAELQAELQSQQTLLVSATSNAQGLEQEYVSLESLLQDSSEQLKAALSNAAIIESAKIETEESLAAMYTENETLKAENTLLQEQVIELESLGPQLDSLNEAMESNTQRLHSVVAQRDQAIEAEMATQTVVAGLQKRIDNQESTIHRLRAKYDQSMEDLKLELNRSAGLESDLQSTSAQVDSLLEKSAVIAQLTAQRDQFADQLKNAETETNTVLANHQQQIDSLVVEGDQLKEQYDAVCAESETLAKQCEELSDVCSEQAELVESLQSERDGYSQQIKSVIAQRDQFADQLASAQSSLDAANGELTQTQIEVARLADEISELQITSSRISELETLVKSSETDRDELASHLEKLRTAYDEVTANNESLEAKLDQIRTQRDGQITAVSRQDSQVRGLQAKLRASEETIRSLRKERAAVLARLANYRTIAEPNAKVISFTEAMEIRKKQEETYDHEYGGPVRRHATRGIVYTQAPKQFDDLKRISGIAEVLEARLNDYGVYTFKQIMDWTPEAIEEFSHLLTFKDRIDRDDWISQARYFYDEKQRVGRSYAA
jgi:predicted flap endonuclease-1-like 5' DNA nuclease